MELSHGNERTASICNNIDEPHKHWAKESRHKRVYFVGFYLYKVYSQNYPVMLIG